ncbi:MAG: methyl-accepting chemotaxis protein, partial [Gammaproteobacteria bacterium]|nr:methyl-accepting chemotaxis protein [Gammaproteobacteria bacterium]
MAFSGGLSIRAKLNISIALIFLAVMVVSTLVSVDRERQYALSVAKQQVTDLTTWYFDSLNTMMLTGTMDQRGLLREKLLSRDHVREARVIRGLPVSIQYGSGSADAQAVDDLDNLALQGEPQTVVSETDTGRILTILTPFEATRDTRGVDCLACHEVPEGSVNGAVRVSFSLEEMDAKVKEETLFNIAMNLGLFALGLLIANLLINRWFNRPVSHMMEVLQSRSEGDENARMEWDSNDEMGRLGEVFNTMADNISVAHEREHATANELKSKVDSLLAVVNRVAEGDYSATVGFDGKDAIGELGTRLQVMVDYIRGSIEEKREAVDVLQQKVDLLLQVANHVAEGDLTASVHMEGEDAFAKLAMGVQGMIQSLNELVAQIQHSGVQLAAAATEISASMSQLEVTAENQAQTTHDIAATATEISATTKDLVLTMDEVGRVAERASNSAEDSHAGLSRMENIMRQLAEGVVTVGDKLELLKEKASSISGVVTTISKVADQTNLLSLNAAIEAEKAGESGRGFAVVAVEIRRLADQAAVSTLDIEHMIREMQDSVAVGVDSIRFFTDLVRHGVNEVQIVSKQQSEIIDLVETLSPRFEAVHQAMHFQSQGAEQINEAMIKLNE